MPSPPQLLPEPVAGGPGHGTMLPRYRTAAPGEQGRVASCSLIVMEVREGEEGEEGGAGRVPTAHGSRTRWQARVKPLTPLPRAPPPGPRYMGMGTLRARTPPPTRAPRPHRNACTSRTQTAPPSHPPTPALGTWRGARCAAR